MEKEIYIGYNLKYGHKGYGSLKDYPKENIIEMPIAENLMVGTAIGLAMEGFRPVVFFERFDFVLNGFDAIVNHLDKYFQYPVAIKIIIGSAKPLNPGVQHCQDYTEALKLMVKNIDIFESKSLVESQKIMNKYWKLKRPIIIIEKREIYNK